MMKWWLGIAVILLHSFVAGRAEAACAAGNECTSKLNGYAVLQSNAISESKVNGYAVLCSPAGVGACPAGPVATAGGLLLLGVGN
jgi:hypothetical protein